MVGKTPERLRLWVSPLRGERLQIPKTRGQKTEEVKVPPHN
jgi:hypothetical protein